MLLVAAALANLAVWLNATGHPYRAVTAAVLAAWYLIPTRKEE